VKEKKVGCASVLADNNPALSNYYKVFMSLTKAK
jgi:hypothetical protein